MPALALFHLEQAVVLCRIRHQLVLLVAVDILVVEQPADEILLLDAQLLGSFAEVGQQVPGHQLVKILGLRLHDLVLRRQLLDAGIAVGQSLLGDQQRLCHKLLRGKLLLPGDVAAVLADAGQHHGRDPLAEGFGLRLIAAQDDVIQAGLADNAHHLRTAMGVNLTDPLFIVIQAVRNHAAVAEAQHIAHILQDEPRFVVDAHGAHQLVFLVLENRNFVHNLSPFRFLRWEIRTKKKSGGFPSL